MVFTVSVVLYIIGTDGVHYRLIVSACLLF